jgi:thiol reductant ABC exporter CydC subunit
MSGMLRLGAAARRRFVAGAALGVVASMSATGLLLTSAWLISRAAEHPPVLYLMVAIVAVRTFGVSRAVFRYAERLVTHDAALRAMTQIRISVYEQVERLAPAGLGNLRRGDAVHRVVSDTNAIQDRLLRARLPWWVSTVVVAGTIGFVGVIAAPAAVVMLSAAVCCGWGVPAAVRRSVIRSQQDVAPLRGDLAAAVAEAVRGVDDLVAYGAGDQTVRRVVEIDRQLARAQRRVAWTNGFGLFVVRLAVGAALVGVCVVTVPLVSGRSLDPVLLAVVVLAPLGIADALEALPAIAQQRVTSAGSVERLEVLPRMPDPVCEPAQPAAQPLTWELSMRGLVAGWPDSRGFDGPPVLDGLDLDLPAGRVAAVVGPSGVGKTTLAYTLLRLLEHRAGVITLGGVDTRALAGDDVRRVIGLLGQDEHVFDTSIRENLRIAQPAATDAELELAIAQARLLGFVHSLPHGLDTMVGENGSRLSGGERQRLALARILLGEHRVLILDEPTEHLDEATARALTYDLLDLAPERSILLITHRPHGLDRADLVVDLGAGGRMSFAQGVKAS